MNKPYSSEPRDVFIFIGYQVAKYIDRYKLDKDQASGIMNKWLMILPLNSMTFYEWGNGRIVNMDENMMNYMGMLIGIGGAMYVCDKIAQVSFG